MNDKNATRIIFLIAGLVTASWAVMVPYAKTHTGVNDAILGNLLLCLGLGAMIAMPLAGPLTSRFGCRKVIITAVLSVMLTMPLLSLTTIPLLLGIGLFLFGIGIGITDCAMNVQAILVEKNAPLPLMSGFHGMFSVGGIAGAGLMTGLLYAGLDIFTSTLFISQLVLLLLLLSFKHLLPYANPAEGPAFAVPRGVVLIFGVICFVIFLAEGTVLDWSAIYLVETRGVEETLGGLGFVAFAVAMTAGRLTGDRVINRLGALRVVMAGSALAFIGFVMVINSASLYLILSGYMLIGVGCANIVPVMFSQTGKQTTMPQMVAVPAVTTLGYIGVLAGPAIIGHIAHFKSIAWGFWFVALLIVMAAVLCYSIRGMLKARP